MARFDSALFKSNFAVGSLIYSDHYPGHEQHARIVVFVAPERNPDATLPIARGNILLQAKNGDNLYVQATFFIPELLPGESWNFPNFLGLDGFLNRIRFAVDPAENTFYFGPSY